MVIGFFGASGRTDALHAALLVARAIAARDGAATLAVEGGGIPVPPGDPTLRVIRLDVGAGLGGDAIDPAGRIPGRGLVLEMGVGGLGRPGVGAVLDMAVVAVGPHDVDERAAAAIGAALAGPAPWYLGCRRAGGAPAAARFAATMSALEPGSRTLPYALPPLGRGEAAKLWGAPPAGRTLTAALSLLAAIRRADAAGRGRVAPVGSIADTEGDRIDASADGRSLPDRLRELADDMEAAGNGLPPDPAELAAAPMLDSWSVDVVPAPVLKGRVTGHPGIVDGHRARTSEVYLTDRATYARTLSRWYRLRMPEGAPANGLQ